MRVYLVPAGHAVRPRPGYFLYGVGVVPVPPSAASREPEQKRAVAFVDGQNLYHCVRECFGYSYPNYDVMALARAVCNPRQWLVSQVKFYTGIPAPSDDPRWNRFWSRKLLSMNRQGVQTFSRQLRYREKRHRMPGGGEFTFTDGEEKGIDVRMAIDIIRMAHRREYDVALVSSQDQDLSEVAKEIVRIAGEQQRWIKMACAYPVGATGNQRGIYGTDWIPIDRSLYDTCVDPFDYSAPPR